ncbi:SCO family protein [Mesobacillus subterraneus]|uniref:SCO family protein n=1 Tax=Mesobacillus subterraneus TaxID=285983 RepID=A0A427TPT8_9BACI|nr:SCO family protein [Mesobacillus subterraneus]RSD26328.1 SCO family protein [Mesobacillus subterraneus]
MLLVILAAITFIAAGCGNGGLKDAKNYPIEDFTFTNQDGKSFGKEDLKGKVWVADFIFTNCADVCPPMTANMAKLQDMIKEEGLKDVEIVSFSVDPTVDSPEVLKDYGNKFSVDFSNWSFLTGYSQEEIEQFALESFKALVKKPESGDQVIHGTDFYLVDQNGNMRKYYTGLKEVPFEQIIKDIKTLQ